MQEDTNRSPEEIHEFEVWLEQNLMELQLLYGPDWAAALQGAGKPDSDRIFKMGARWAFNALTKEKEQND